MKRFAGLIAALAMAVLVAACGDGGGEKGSETIPIAVVGPVTGQYAAFGAQMTNGGQMAVDDINAAGGVLGKKLDLSIGDDACDPKQAVAVANQMTGNGVALVAVTIARARRSRHRRSTPSRTWCRSRPPRPIPP